MTQIISSAQVKDLIEKGALLLDVRTEKEFKQDALNGAINYPITQIAQKVKGLDMSKALIVYCRTGRRSAEAKALLEGIGFKEVHNAGTMCNYLGA